MPAAIDLPPSLTPAPETGRVLRLPELRARVGLSTSTIYRFMQDGTFPAPVKLGTRAVGWWERDVLIWQASRPSARQRAA